MMREIEGVTDEPRTRRRWFHDDQFDLFVWETEGGDITLFQLCYASGAGERALVWHRDAGFFHDGADFQRLHPGAPGNGKRSPQPKPDQSVINHFEEAAKSLPGKVRRAVSQRVREYLAGTLRVSARRKRFRREQWQDPSTTH